MDKSTLRINWSRELDGVHYASFSWADRSWRLGSIRPDWRDFAAQSVTEDISGIWIQPAGSPDSYLAAMCCGLGSVWPGMGRELYENFPAARHAMDYLASLADWDLLGLMDESGTEKISQSRWQIPYLFMLEYAQWRQFGSLGLTPKVIFGHSLGELIALCLAAVYDARSAWLLLETRAGHMQDLEARSDKQGGMLAVPAGQAEIDETLAQWPDLRISNRNTARQFILSGNRAHLLEARRFLRRKHIPAIMLNMDLAFHNPAMRILRDISIRRMNGLNMKPAATILLSCVTARPYPAAREEICRAIADLDENTVDWVTLIEAARRNYHIDAWLEIGPQETLCGITGELSPDSLFFASDRKNHEAEAMAETCARLFVAGYLDQGAISRECARREVRKWPTGRVLPLYKPAVSAHESEYLDINLDELQKILDLLSEISGVSRIEPGMDLRRDLGLRSASFPFVMLEAEARLGRPVQLDNLFQITTVLDLARFLTGNPPESVSRSQVAREEYRLARAAVNRHIHKNGIEIPAPFDPRKYRLISRGVELHIYDSMLKPKIESSLGALGCRLLPAAREPWASFEASEDGVAAIVFAPPLLSGPDQAQALDKLASLASHAASAKAQLYVIQRFIAENELDCSLWFDSMDKFLISTGARYKLIACVTPPVPQYGSSFGDLLNWELLNDDDETRIIWNALPGKVMESRFCPASYGSIWPLLAAPVKDDGGVFQYECQFSDFSLPDIQGHGANAVFTPLSQQNCDFMTSPWLPVSDLLAAMCRAATINNPWLLPAGFTDLRIFRFLAIPKGVTRECRLFARAGVELPLSGAMTRHCLVSAQSAQLTPTGRKTGVWQQLSKAIFLLCLEPPKPAQSTSFYGTGRTLDADLLYDALGLGETWRQLDNLRETRWQDGTLGLEARIHATSIGDGFRLYDVALLAAYAALGIADANNSAEVAARLAEWRLYGMGFSRFDFERARGECRLQLRPTWRSARLARFDIHIIAESGLPVLALNNLEFDFVQTDKEEL